MVNGLIILYLILFPFGKLLGVIPDVIIFLFFLLNLIRRRNFIPKGQASLIIACAFSLLFSLSFFKLPQIFVGILYLIRLVAYFSLTRIKFKNKKFIFNGLIIVGVFIAIFGWIQYFFFPDLRALKMLGWDDHYFRLVSTYLDPAFTGILLVLVEILVITKTIQKKSRFIFLLNIFLIITILFTYSRASYLALFFAFLFLFIKLKKKFVLILLILFILLIPILPKRSGGEGVNLSRTYSIVDKFINYKDSLNLIKKSPIFGIGFDNVCVAKQQLLQEKNVGVHSCNGLDNSILFIVATTGVIGLMLFLQMIYKIILNTKFDVYGWGLMASFIAIFVHGMFTNTFFYNFVLGWIAILIGITRKVRD